MTWPDKATVERVKDALFIEFHRTGQLGNMARAALSVLPDPTADTVLLDKVRERLQSALDAPFDPTRSVYGDLAHDLAALLAGGGE